MRHGMITVTITPNPVVVNQPWHVSISGLKANQPRIILGNGWDDGGVMFAYVSGSFNLNDAELTATASGTLDVDPPLLEPTSDGMYPPSILNFQVTELQVTHGTSRTEQKLLAMQPYNVTV
jgi:hypothetical protein